MAHLRLMNILVAIYIYDTINLHASRAQCAANTDIIIDMFNKLGFTIHQEKSCRTPSQIMEFLGFAMNSVDMTVKLSDSKKEAILMLCNRFLVRNL